MPNPFSILGIKSQILQTLKRPEAEILAQAVFRALSRIYHPDNPSGGNRKRFEEIIEAYKLLTQSPESFTMWYKQSIKLRKEQIVDMEQQVISQEGEIKTLRERQFSFWKALSQAEGLSIFNCVGKRILVSDFLQGQWRTSLRRANHEFADPFLPQESREITVQEHTILTARAHKVMNSKSIPAEPKWFFAGTELGWSILPYSQEVLSKYHFDTDQPKEEEMKLLGTFSNVKGLLEMLFPSNPTTLQLEGKYDEIGQVRVEGISLEHLSHFCAEMSPLLTTNSVLVACKAGRAYFLGKIIGVA